MKQLFTTDQATQPDAFKLWQDVSRARLPPFQMWKLGDEPFHASWEATQIGFLRVSRTAFGAHRMRNDPYTVRHGGKHDTLVCVLRLAGLAHGVQHDRSATQQPGDLAVFDSNAPLTLEFPVPTRTLRLELPRERLEQLLGSVRRFAALPADAGLPSVILARSYLTRLIQVHESLGPATVETMAGIAVDLVAAAMAEQLARDTPLPSQGTVTVQRAKAFVEANLNDPTLDSQQLAAAVGVSLRRLQALFKDRGRSVAEWIWQRRLETAAQNLADPNQVQRPVATVALDCGFTSPAHFSHRFRDRYGISPRDFRDRALLAAAGRPPDPVDGLVRADGSGAAGRSSR